MKGLELKRENSEKVEPEDKIIENKSRREKILKNGYP